MWVWKDSWLTQRNKYFCAQLDSPTTNQRNEVSDIKQLRNDLTEPFCWRVWPCLFCPSLHKELQNYLIGSADLCQRMITSHESDSRLPGREVTYFIPDVRGQGFIHYFSFYLYMYMHTHAHAQILFLLSTVTLFFFFQACLSPLRLLLSIILHYFSLTLPLSVLISLAHLHPSRLSLSVEDISSPLLYPRTPFFMRPAPHPHFLQPFSVVIK